MKCGKEGKQKTEENGRMRSNIARKKCSLLYLCIHVFPLRQEPSSWNLTVPSTVYCPLHLFKSSVLLIASRDTQHRQRSKTDRFSFSKSDLPADDERGSSRAKKVPRVYKVNFNSCVMDAFKYLL